MRAGNPWGQKERVRGRAGGRAGGRESGRGEEGGGAQRQAQKGGRSWRDHRDIANTHWEKTGGGGREANVNGSQWRGGGSEGEGKGKALPGMIGGTAFKNEAEAI